MGACATKPGDLKVKGEAPVVAEDAAAAPVASEEKAKADGVVVPAAAEADPADASRRRSLSDLLKQDAETIDREADQEAAEKVVAAAPATGAAGDAGATMGDGEADQEAAEKVVSVEPATTGAAGDAGETMGDGAADQEAAEKVVSVEPATGAAGDAEATMGDGEADQEAAEKVVAVEPATGAAGDAEATMGDAEADQEAAEKVVALEPATGDAGDAGAATVGAQAPVQASAAAEQDGDGAAGELKDDPHGDVQAVVEEEKRVDPDSVQVVAPAAAAAPSAEEGKVADDASA